jgi:hypothetical protein
LIVDATAWMLGVRGTALTCLSVSNWTTFDTEVRAAVDAARAAARI